MHKATYIFLFLAFILNVHFELKAQDSPKIIIRKTEKNFEFDSKGQIIIDAERGDISIQELGSE